MAKNKHISFNPAKSFGLFASWLAIILMSLPGCTDELNLTGDQNTGDADIEGDCIAFTIELSRDLESRAEQDGFSLFTDEIEKYENYIDTQDKFRVFFFTESGDFLFGATDRTVSSLLNTDNSKDYWYVRIPMTMIVDRENQEYDIDKIKNYLKNHKFKIAVLANWPNGGEKINPADWDDSEGNHNSSENPSSTLKGNPRWNWSNSILNKDADPADIRNINDLHHVYNDLYYGADSRMSIYENFMAYVNSGNDPGYYMGEPTDWVKMRDVEKGWQHPNGQSMADVNGNGGFSNRTEANIWIRANCTPNVEVNQNKGIYRHYQHMWFLWNFDASYKTGLYGNPSYNADGSVASVSDGGYYKNNWGWNDGYTGGDANPFGKEWYKRNGDILYKWMNASYNNGANPLPIGSKTIDIGESNNDVFFKYVSKTGYPAYCVKVGDNYGIQLPNIGEGPVSTNTEGMITFQARTSGTLRIKWSSADGTSSGLGVQVSSTYRPQKNITSTTPINWTHTDNLQYWDISVEGNSEPIYIYGVQGKAVVFSIEFIRGRYLYETDREGVAPTSNQGIPMYGVKLFDEIPEWQRGTTINLPSNISLIRALAKVEVFIQANFGMPRHVFMRNMNRAARCEPMDVETSTDLIWNDKHSIDNNGSLSENCEWFRIQKYGPSYRDNDISYTDWLSWFYASWKNASWKTDNYVWNYEDGYYKPKEGNLGGWKKSSFNYSSFTSEEPPHIFNPYYYRSDFCRFLYAGTVNGGYHRFVLYVPEKNIDDPSTAGRTSSTPRVPHIEYRFSPKPYSPEDNDIEAAEDDPYSNTEYNLDDNDCYRIYFTNYGYAGDNSQNVNVLTDVNEELYYKKWNSTTYDNYEKDTKRLSYHWPIMRNHRYQFFVGGEGPQNPEIHVKVLDWSHAKVVFEW